MNNLQKTMNEEAWKNVQEELRCARQMFNYAIDEAYIDMAIEIEKLALAKKRQLEKKILYERDLTTEIYEPKQQGLKRFTKWLFEPFKEIYKEMKEKEAVDLKRVDKLTWNEVGNNLGFKFKPIESYNDGGTSNDIQKKI